VTATVRAIGAAIGVLLALPALSADESGAPIPKPEVKVGDSWTYRRTDNLSAAANYTYDNRVTFTAPDEILVISKRWNRSDETDNFFTAEWNAIALGTLTLSPRTGFFKFPLKPGATHETTYETARRGSPVRAQYKLTAKVVGWEEIMVPAGKFRALKVEAIGTFSRLDVSWGGSVRVDFWYVPEVKRWVKYSYEEGRGAQRYANFSDELVGVSLQ